MNIQGAIKPVIWHLDTGDHHSQYDIYVLIDGVFDVDVLMQEFRAAYPFRCPAHPYDSDPPTYGCDLCDGREEVAVEALVEDGLDVPERGFWNLPFASWLEKLYGAIVLDVSENVTVAYFE